VKVAGPEGLAGWLCVWLRPGFMREQGEIGGFIHSVIKQFATNSIVLPKLLVLSFSLLYSSCSVSSILSKEW
jgi:hypothetical protein